MTRKSKVIFIVLIIALVLQYSANMIDRNKDRDEYKLSVYNYLVSVDDILDILITSDANEEDMRTLSRNLVVRMDRLEKFIYHSDVYLDFDYQSRKIVFLCNELEGIVIDNSIDEIELERLIVVNHELDRLIDRISSSDNDEENVNYDLSVEAINSAIDEFVYNTQ